jgi:hypothetical protein
MLWLFRIMGCLNSAHIDGTLVPVEEPSTASVAEDRGLPAEGSAGDLGRKSVGAPLPADEFTHAALLPSAMVRTTGRPLFWAIRFDRFMVVYFA